MHVRNFLHISVENEDPDTLGADISNALDSKLDAPEGSMWYDWWVIGGRYAQVLDGRNFIPIKDAKPYLEMAMASATREFLSSRDTINGTAPTQAPDQVWGLSVTEADAWMQSVGDYRTKIAHAVQAILQAESPYKAMEIARASLAAHTLQALATMVSDYWGADSYFYSFEDWTTNPLPLIERIDKGETNDDEYLVVVDFHF